MASPIWLSLPLSLTPAWMYSASHMEGVTGAATPAMQAGSLGSRGAATGVAGLENIVQLLEVEL
jgi:hypothetical protein